jgi:hypothetical protein
MDIPLRRVREFIACKYATTLFGVGRGSYTLKICNDGLRTADGRSFARREGKW